MDLVQLRLVLLSYAIIRFLLVIEYIRVWYRLPSTRPLTKRYSIGFAVSATIWTISAFVPPPLRFILWGVGMTIDLVTPLLIGQLAIKFAPHESHLPERMGLFVIIVLGESIRNSSRSCRSRMEHLFNIVSWIRTKYTI
jgi:low temperature requirement protein LtrA